jgi:hypothetical protein
MTRAESGGTRASPGLYESTYSHSIVAGGLLLMS